MVVLVVGLVYVLTVTAGAPAVLARGTWQVWHPRLALMLWHAALMSCAAVMLVGITTGLGMATEANDGAGYPPAVVAAIAGAWALLFAIGGIAAMALARCEPLIKNRQARREHLEEVLGVSGFDMGSYRGVSLRIVNTDDVVLAACHAPEPTIVISRGTASALSTSQLRAALEHERCHLVQRHHLALTLAAVNAVCLPWLPAARDLERSTRRLVEIIADDFAVQQCGCTAVADALRVMAEIEHDESLASRSRRAAAREPGQRTRFRSPGFVSAGPI